mgnify:CR=1 FL=1
MYKITDKKKIASENFYVEVCPENSVNVCFGKLKEKCDIVIENKCSNDCEDDFDKGVVEKQESRVEYSTKALMYGAIFSDNDIYQCETKRLMKKLGNLVGVYYDESQFVSTKNCNSGLEPELLQLQSVAGKFNGNFNLLDNIIKDLGKKNEETICNLW